MNTPSSPFLTENYTPQRNIIRVACKQLGFYLSKVLDTNESEDEITDNLIKYYMANTEKFAARKAKFLIKNKDGDRVEKEAPLDKVFGHVIKKNYHFSPNMVAYVNADVEESINSIGTREFIKNRGFYKGKRKDADRANDKMLYDKYDKLQNAFKVFNNAQSGAMSSEGTPINNITGHSSSTSTCRCLTSTANLTNEQFITGNRFYYTPNSTLQSIVARIKSTDLKALDDVIKKYNLKYPSAKSVIDMITRNSFRYWESSSAMEIIEEFIIRLKPIELAAVLYVLDLTSLFNNNQAFMTQFFDEWQTVPSEARGETKADNKDRDILAISKLPHNATQSDIAALNHYHLELESKYSDFFKVIFRSMIPPTALFDVTTSIRDCVLTSDTDSSIYTVDKLVEAYTHDKGKRMRLNAVLTYFIRMISIDQIYQLSTNMNVSKRNRSILNMKNEYYFGGYITTLMSKHYYASQFMVEGVMKETPEMEIKGLYLRGASIPNEIKEIGMDLMVKILNAIESGEQLNASDELFKIAEVERKVIADLKEGKWNWFGRASVKGKKLYKKPMSSNYYYHELWSNVFSAKYGTSPDLPYVGIKVNVSLSNKTKLKEFIDNLEDTKLANRFRQFNNRTDRDKFDTLILPMETIQSLGAIPQEIVDMLDVRTVIKQNFKSIYIILESAGLYFLNENITRLVSDEH